MSSIPSRIGSRVASNSALRENPTLAAKAFPIVIAVADAGIAWRSPGAARTMVPGAATPVATTYLLVSPAKVTTSPARTVPDPVMIGIEVVPIAKPAAEDV